MQRARPLCTSAFTWSFIRLMSGDTTSVMPGQQQRGQLVAHGFARARGHDAHDVAPLQKRVDELLLPGAKTLVAENRFEQRAFFTHRLCFHSKNSS